MLKKKILYLFVGGVFYLLTAKLGMSIFALEPTGLSLLWLPFGIGVVLVEVYGLKALGIIFIASFLAHFNITTDTHTAAIIHRIIPALADALAPLLSVFFIKKFINNDFNSTAVIFPFTVLAGVIPTLLSGTLIAYNLSVAGYITHAEINSFIVMLVFSDTLGLLLLYPLYKNFDTIIPTTQEQNILFVNIFAGMLIVLLSIEYHFFIFLLYPLLLIATFKIKMKYLMVILLLIVIFTISVSSKFGVNFFMSDTQMNSILMLSSFLATFVFIIMGIGLHNQEAQKNRKLTLVDNLTKTLNRRAYEEHVDKMIYNFKRYGYTFSIILLDIDDFKKINDDLGHSVGDDVLIQLSTLIKNSLRNSDYLFRVGGEEFVVLLSNTELKKAQEVAQKLRLLIESELHCYDKRVITISLGVTEIQDEDDKGTLYERVDKLQYISKKSGKNRVTSCLA